MISHRRPAGKPQAGANLRRRHVAVAGPGIEYLVDQAEGLGFVGLEELAAGLVDPSYREFLAGEPCIRTNASLPPIAS